MEQHQSAGERVHPRLYQAFETAHQVSSFREF